MGTFCDIIITAYLFFHPFGGFAYFCGNGFGDIETFCKDDMGMPILINDCLLA
jgi:hypothetical protein